MDGRFRKRLAGFLVKRVREVPFSQVSDPRARRGRTWKLPTLLNSVLVGMCAGVRSLADLEELTESLSRGVRRVLGIFGRVPDTTLRDLLVRLPLDGLRSCLHAVIRAAHRRKALEPVDLPFGIASMDGKCTAIEDLDHPYSQVQTHGGSMGASGLVRTVTSVLASSASKAILDCSPIPRETNEDGHFATALHELVATYGVGPYFRMVAYDSGACSRANAEHVVGHGLWYLFRLDAKQPTILAELERQLGHLPAKEALARTEDVTGDGSLQRMLFVTTEIAGWHDWTHLSVGLRVHSQRYDRQGNLVSQEDRYYISSCPARRLTSAQWLRVIRWRWSVENAAHNILDTAFAEDDKPWITGDAQGMLALLVIRRIACTLVALFRSVTQRGEDQRQVRFRSLLAGFYAALLSATAAHLDGLAPRIESS